MSGHTAAAIVTGPMPNGNQAVISTSAALRAELEAINGRGWQADMDY